MDAGKGESPMKKILMIALLSLGVVSAVYAASCTEGNIKLTGETCGVVDGHCACTGNGN
jgi:energy-converting hydrogenase Eha subunit C